MLKQKDFPFGDSLKNFLKKIFIKTIDHELKWEFILEDFDVTLWKDLMKALKPSVEKLIWKAL